MSHRSVPFLALLLLASGAHAGEVRVLTLPNGAEAVLAPGPGPNRLAFELAVGPRDDPADKPGVSLVAARSLLLGTQAHPTSGQLAERLVAAAESWSSGLEADRTRIDAEGVGDWDAALDLGIQVLAEPRFGAGEMLRLRLDLAAEAARGAEGRVAREAAALLLPTARRQADAFDLLQVEQADLRELHARAYRADRLRVVLQGDLPPAELLDGLLLRTLGSWAGGSGSSDPGDELSAPGPDHRPVHAVHGGPTGLSVAFPAGKNTAASALALTALSVRLGDGWSLPAGAASLGAEPGDAIVLQHDGPDPAAARSRLERELGRFAKKGPRSKDVREARALLAAKPDGDATAVLLACAPRGRASADLGVQELAWPAAELSRDVSAEAVRAAAEQLAGGARATVLSFADEAGARAHASSASGVVVRGLTEPIDAIARELEREGARWVQRAGEAHGGAAFRSVQRVTILGERVLQMGEAERSAGFTRVDVDLASLQARQETRPRSQRADIHVVVFDGDRAFRMVNQGALDQGPLGSMSFRTTLLRTPFVALHRAVTSGDPVRSRGRIELEGRAAQLVEVADTAGGLATLAFDSETSRLVQVRFRNRLPFRSEPMNFTLGLSGHRMQDGVLVYGVERLTLGDSDRANLWRDLAWSFRTDVPTPLELLTDINDLGRVRQD